MGVGRGEIGELDIVRLYMQCSSRSGSKLGQREKEVEQAGNGEQPQESCSQL